MQHRRAVERGLIVVLLERRDGAGGTSEATAGKTVHQAFAVVWGFQDPRAGTIRFTIRVEAGEWHEIGEVSRDGTNWMQFFEMKLKRR